MGAHHTPQGSRTQTTGRANHKPTQTHQQRTNHFTAFGGCGAAATAPTCTSSRALSASFPRHHQREECTFGAIGAGSCWPARVRWAASLGSTTKDKASTFDGEWEYGRHEMRARHTVAMDDSTRPRKWSTGFLLPLARNWGHAFVPWCGSVVAEQRGPAQVLSVGRQF